jgi:hypothetical protein
LRQRFIRGGGTVGRAGSNANNGSQNQSVHKKFFHCVFPHLLEKIRVDHLGKEKILSAVGKSQPLYNTNTYL